MAGLMMTTMVVACTPKSAERGDGGVGAGSAAQDTGPQATVTVTEPAAHATGVEPLAKVVFTVQHADRTQVEVTDADGATVKGKTAPDGGSWQPEKAFAWGRAYTATVTATTAGGTSTTATSSFRIKKKPAKVVRVTSPFGDGRTWGVGMVMVLKFGRSIPERYRADIEKRITVESTPTQEGSWNWFAKDELHYRPKTFWKAGTKIGYNAQLTGVPMGQGWYGNAHRSFTGTIGRSLIITVDDRTKTMTVKKDGTTVRTIPVSLGAARTPSSSGTHLIMTRERHARFNTMGAQDPRDRYDIPVEYAQRLTWQGEYIHAASWSEPSQGKVNVSHGCINISVKNAAWLFANTLVGDPVTTKGTPRKVDHANGYTDWNSDWDDYRNGSALN
uniref:ErfK/YbiS/YcfS/YnhG family protein n=1 Tax=uncultured bacterium esnapd1.2 TaxID=1366589 RepID=S5UBL1_9BACT|nr:ErfK/YbiS/YcfS/YnhG family protein [uncultured bacterium esnapd1.2]